MKLQRICTKVAFGLRHAYLTSITNHEEVEHVFVRCTFVRWRFIDNVVRNQRHLPCSEKPAHHRMLIGGAFLAAQNVSQRSQFQVFYVTRFFRRMSWLCTFVFSNLLSRPIHLHAAQSALNATEWVTPEKTGIMNQTRIVSRLVFLAALLMMCAPLNAQINKFQHDQVSVAANSIRVNESVRRISVNEYGILQGRISTIDQANEVEWLRSGISVFFVQNGEVIKQTRTMQDGSFEIIGIPEGAYSFFAAGNSGFTAQGIYVQGHDGQSEATNLESSLASANYFGIQQLLKYNVPAQVSSTVRSEVSSTIETNVIGTSNQFRLINGYLRGTIHLFDPAQSAAGVHVHIIQNDQPIAQVQTDEEGNFSIPDMVPGIYDLVAAGEKGYAAGRFEAVGPRPVMTRVSYRKSPKLEFTLTQAGDVDRGGAVEGNDALVEPSLAETGQYAGESVTLGGASGGSAGAANNFTNFSGGGIVRGRFGGRGIGLGGFRGGRGAGRLLLLGGLIGGLATIDSNNPNPGSPDGS